MPITRNETDILKQIGICNIDLEENEYSDIRHVMARSQLRVFRWMLGKIGDDEL
jgi:hypothetical protein